MLKSQVQGSNILSSVKDANCYIELDENMQEVSREPSKSISIHINE